VLWEQKRGQEKADSRILRFNQAVSRQPPIALFVGIVALHDVALRIVRRTPVEQDPSFEIAIFLPVVRQPALARNFIGAGFGDGDFKDAAREASKERD